jgi:hypothetical protein
MAPIATTHFAGLVRTLKTKTAEQTSAVSMLSTGGEAFFKRAVEQVRLLAGNAAL